MNTLEYLNSGKTLIELEEEFKIKISQNEKYPSLYCLNYNQIESVKDHPIVRECRSLVLKDEGNFKFSISSRSFDRFFNYGESKESFDINKLIAYEKIDGSLLNIWFDLNYGWLYRTRSMIMPDNDINDHPVRWDELIIRNIGDISNLNVNCTYICEIVSKWNRVVTKYSEEGVYLLSVRDNQSGMYIQDLDVLGWEKPKKYFFNTYENCIFSAKELPNLEEGYVLYTHSGVPVLKVKNPAYVCAHFLRGEGTPPPKRIMDLVIMNEQDEYLAIFPEDTELFKPYIEALRFGLTEANETFLTHKSIENQKEFALKIKDYHFSGLLFLARSRGGKPSDYFQGLTRPAQYRFIELVRNQCQN